MLSSVTGFFFGSAAAETLEVTPVDLKTKESNEGWIIVDVNDNSKSTQQEQQSASPNLSVVMETDNPMSDNTEGESSCPSETETDFGGSQPTSSPESLSPSSRGHFKYRAKVDSSESWIVTPPPCFSARRKNSSVDEHPLENLLIEHPSMSVYNSICDSTVSEISMVSVSSESELNEEEPVSSRTRQQTQAEQPQQVVIARRHQPQLVAPSSGINIQLDRVKGIRQHQRRSTKKYNKSYLERSNKCLEFQSCGKKQRQRNKIICKSGAMNARYGQR